MPLQSRFAHVCSIVLVHTLLGSLAHASEPEAPAPPRAPASATMRRARAPARFVVARDLVLTVPVGSLADEAAPMVGPLVRLAFNVDDSFEVGVRAAYLRGFEKEVAGTTGSLSLAAFHGGARWFMFGRRSGPYAAGELGASIFRQKRTRRTSLWDVGADATWARPSTNVGVGWVWSRSLPIDVRVHLAALDLLADGGPTRALGVGVTAGYSIFF